MVTGDAVANLAVVHRDNIHRQDQYQRPIGAKTIVPKSESDLQLRWLG